MNRSQFKKMNSQYKYKRILLKLSGEVLGGGTAHKKGVGIDGDVLAELCSQIAELVTAGVQVGIVIGGGNFFRGISGSKSGISRASSDSMGMLATVMNAIALSEGLKKIKIESRLQSALSISSLVESYALPKTLSYLDQGKVVIFAGGLGNPFFTTDTAASLRAIEIEADVLVKATKVNGVYDSDPSANPGAIKYDRISYDDVLRKKLAVMDSTAIALCRDNDLSLQVVSIEQNGALMSLVEGKQAGTRVSN